MNSLIFLLLTAIVFFFLGMTVMANLSFKLKRSFNVFRERVLLMKSYWLFVVVFCIFTIFGYFVIFSLPRYSKGLVNNQELYLSAFNQILTLIFAIFAGYFAFIQVIENRYDKLIEKSYSYIKDQKYDKAIEVLEQCIKINARDIGSWGNLLECYLITKKFKRFSDKIGMFSSIEKAPEEKIIYYYLIITNELLQQRIGDAKSMLANLTDYIDQNPSALKSFSWSFGEIKSSEVFKSVGSEAKKIFENAIKFLDRTLTEKDQLAFANGDYELIGEQQ